jgi:hypothetical protein
MLPPKAMEYNSSKQLPAVDYFYSAAKPRSSAGLSPSSALAHMILETLCAGSQAAGL